MDALSQLEHLPPGHTLDKTGWSETDREVNTKLYSIFDLLSERQPFAIVSASRQREGWSTFVAVIAGPVRAGDKIEAACIVAGNFLFSMF